MSSSDFPVTQFGHSLADHRSSLADYNVQDPLVRNFYARTPKKAVTRKAQTYNTAYKDRNKV